MSPLRSRSGGTAIGKTDSRKKRSSRNRRAATCGAQRRGWSPPPAARPPAPTPCRRPARSASLRARAGSSPAATSGRSPISSRNSVPRCAISNLPGLRATAPVNAPFSWPNSSVSSSVSGIAAQLIATNGASARSLSACSERANSSLPVPLSPSSSTVVSVAAARCSDWKTLRSDGSSPTSCGAPRRTASSSFSSRFSLTMRRCSSARRTSSMQVVGIDRLGEEVERPFLHRAHGIFELPVRGHHDDRQRRRRFPWRRAARRTRPLRAGAGRTGRVTAGVRCRARAGFGLVAHLDDRHARRSPARAAAWCASESLSSTMRIRAVWATQAGVSGASRGARRHAALLLRSSAIFFF